MLFVSKTSEKSKVRVLRQSRFTPSLDCQTSNEAKRPAVLLAKDLNFLSRSQHPEKMNHFTRPL